MSLGRVHAATTLQGRVVPGVPMGERVPSSVPCWTDVGGKTRFKRTRGSGSAPAVTLPGPWPAPHHPARGHSLRSRRPRCHHAGRHRAAGPGHLGGSAPGWPIGGGVRTHKAGAGPDGPPERLGGAGPELHQLDLTSKAKAGLYGPAGGWGEAGAAGTTWAGR